MIIITKRAAEEIGLSTQNPDAQGLSMRFAVDKTDDGFQYLMGFDERSDGDIHLESNGVEYVLTYAQKELLEGMVVDFDEIDTEGGYGFIL
ncbi:[weak similarity to] sulfur oxidation proteinDsrR [Bathymodiolus azoricus thioautotrophic gill symbiont]|uniref:[weak similarity to] sulfur oxidation proteinDsrR n=1 Tax=Bathymodiolus azoricus thioautotrophic gill symbiont TaxID=235205 RepID=A0A1H6L8P4_9GAMM|nr:[weak similarity to] sulfur oxidation proteinDsrR [Bathymodiolus azoricus thioautotrophic gill symbiont]